MWELIRWMEWIPVIAKRLKWPAMLLVYAVVVEVFGLQAFFCLGAVMGAAVYAFFVDKQREAKGADDFWGDKLFFRYGEEIQRINLPIPVKPEWSTDQARGFASSLRQDLAARIRAQVPPESTQVSDTLTILDIGTQRSKDFLRVLARTPAGCLLVHWIHFAPFGNTVAAQYITYVRGRYSDWDIVKFALASPFSVWLWGFPWLLNRYSLCSMISHFTDSAFDTMDLQTIYTATRQLVLTSSADLLQAAGLLPEVVSQIITNHITNTQNVSVSRSSAVSFGAINQSPALSRAGAA